MVLKSSFRRYRNHGCLLNSIYSSEGKKMAMSRPASINVLSVALVSGALHGSAAMLFVPVFSFLLLCWSTAPGRSHLPQKSMKAWFLRLSRQLFAPPSASLSARWGRSRTTRWHRTSAGTPLRSVSRLRCARPRSPMWRSRRPQAGRQGSAILGRALACSPFVLCRAAAHVCWTQLKCFRGSWAP